MSAATIILKRNDVHVVRVESDVQLQNAYEVRLEVFVEEQKVPVEEEIDALDTALSTVHVVAVDSATGETLGTARLLEDGPIGHFHIGRVAVKKKARGRHVGAALMVALERIASEKVPGVAIHVALSAQVQAIGFYASLGYERITEVPYLDCDIPHVDMVKVIHP